MKCKNHYATLGNFSSILSYNIETRSWKTNYRGELYIHASQRTDKKVLSKPSFSKALRDETLPNSVIIAKCKLVDCVKMDEKFIQSVKEKGFEYDFGEYQIGRYAWFLEDVELLVVPITAK